MARGSKVRWWDEDGPRLEWGLGSRAMAGHKKGSRDEETPGARGWTLPWASQPNPAGGTQSQQERHSSPFSTNKCLQVKQFSRSWKTLWMIFHTAIALSFPFFSSAEDKTTPTDSPPWEWHSWGYGCIGRGHHHSESSPWGAASCCFEQRKCSHFYNFPTFA